MAKKRISKSVFKKWMMGVGFSRNDAEYICSRISARNGISYQKVYSENCADPWLSGILDSILSD